MPSETERQRRFMGAVLRRRDEGRERSTDPKMSRAQLRDYARRPTEADKQAKALEAGGG